MDSDPKVPQYSTADETSFAYVSARERWPVILTSAIDDLHRTVQSLDDKDEHSQTKISEGKRIISEMAALKYELQHNRQLKPLPEIEGQTDIKEYNEELEKRGNPTWMNVAWLYSECYLYRRISTLFLQSSFWQGYDVFGRQKISTFKSSRPAVLELAKKYKELASEAGKGTQEKSEETIEQAEQLLFAEMCEICLWGNATDLSLLTSLTYEDIQKLQGSDARKAAEANILVNEVTAAYEVLRNARRTKKNTNEDRRVDIVLDNAGFELFVDLILAGYLLSADLATTVVLHPKTIPWFVSDVVPSDFASLLNALADPQSFYTQPDVNDEGNGNAKSHPPLSSQEVEELTFLFNQWSDFHSEGKLILRPHPFWTGPGSYWRLPTAAPELFEDLQSSELVLFKGDLNYRKLTADAQWDTTTPFSTAIGPLGTVQSGMRTLAFRTCKADVVVGLPEGVDEKLRGDSPARKWAWGGKWAVVQFWDGKQ